MSDHEYVPLPPQVIDALPNGQAVKRHLLAAMDTQYETLRKARGEVVRPEDAYELTRTVASWVEQAKDLKAAFDAGRARGLQLLQDEMVEAVGEQDGIPNQKSFKVPDAGGDITVSHSTTNVYHIDSDALVSAATAVHLAGDEVDAIRDIVNGDHETIGPDQLEDTLAELCASVVITVLACGKFEPQVTKVNAYADAIARGGDDALSAVVRSAIRKTVKSNGVTMKRKAN